MECVAAFPPYTYLPHDLLPSVWEPRVLHLRSHYLAHVACI